MSTCPAGAEALVTVLRDEVPAACVEDMIGLQTVPLGGCSAAVVTLSRPAQHNALNLAGWHRIAEVFAQIASDPSVRAVVVRGAGDRAFGAGADISEFPANRLGADAARSYNAAIASALQAVQSLPVPVIAMIGGLAVGGGCELATACDVRLASEDSRFGIPIGKLGVTLGLTETRAVTGVIGAANLKYLVFSGRRVDASLAFGWGLVQQVVPREALAESTATLVWSILTSSEVTMRATKLVTALAADPSTDDRHALLDSLHDEAYAGADLREGVDAFLASRTPHFNPERSAAHGRA